MVRYNIETSIADRAALIEAARIDAREWVHVLWGDIEITDDVIEDCATWMWEESLESLTIEVDNEEQARELYITTFTRAAKEELTKLSENSAKSIP